MQKLFGGPYIARVTQFDFEVGIGVVELHHMDDSTNDTSEHISERVPFQCMVIDDRSRFVELGAFVAVTLAPGQFGRREVRRLTKLSEASGKQ